MIKKMKLTRFFRVLESVNSEVRDWNCFTTGSTLYVPDFFIVFLYLTIFCFTVFFDIILLFFIFLGENIPIYGVVLALTSFVRIIIEFFVEKTTPSQYSQAFSEKLALIFNVIGLRSILISARILKNCSEFEENIAAPSFQTTFPVFHIPNEYLCLIRIYCCISVVFKCIPQLYILSTLLLSHRVSWSTSFMATVCILLYITLFAFTVSITFPLRKTPTVFRNSVCVFFNALNKFMATWCACCLNLAIFAVAFKNFRLFALFTYFFRCIIWLWPCCHALKSEGAVSSRVYFLLYSAFFTLVYGFIYIHPFEENGKLHYYFFYLITSLSDLAIIYLVADGSIDVVTCYFIIRVIMLTFLFCFGLLNFLHTLTPEKDKGISRTRLKSAQVESDMNTNRKVSDDADKKKSKSDQRVAEIPELQIVEKKDEDEDEREGGVGGTETQ